MYQKLIIIGRLGRDPELRYTPDGTPVCKFSVATDQYAAKDAKSAKTVWFQVAAWRKLAEACSKYLSKGRLVMVEGQVTPPKPYQARDGEWRACLDVQAHVVKFLSSKREDSSEDGGGEEPAPSTVEEIPF